jgi:hypothetical protein
MPDYEYEESRKVITRRYELFNAQGGAEIGKFQTPTPRHASEPHLNI